MFQLAVSPDEIIELDTVPAELREPLHSVIVNTVDQPYPFMIVKPQGIHKLYQIHKLLSMCKLEVVDDFCISNYEELARYIYGIPGDNLNSYNWFMLNRKLFPLQFNRAHVLVLHHSLLDDYERVVDAKRQIRISLGQKTYRVRYYGVEGTIMLNPVHAPDPEQIQIEYTKLLSISKRAIR